MLDALATARGLDKMELVTRILAKADVMAEYSGQIVGVRQRIKDQVLAATTPVSYTHLTLPTKA